MLANFEGWSRFYTFSRERGIDFGSPWYALTLVGVDLPGDAVNSLASGSFLLACAAIAWLVLRAPQPPRLASLAFLTVGAFVLTNKVYSPQYVLWVLPLAVLARPRWRDLLIWQAAESAYFVGIWWFLVGYGTQDKGLHEGWYVAATAAHWLATAWLMALVARDAWSPQPRPDPHRRLPREHRRPRRRRPGHVPPPRICSKSRAPRDGCSKSRARPRPESWIRSGSGAVVSR